MTLTTHCFIVQKSSFRELLLLLQQTVSTDNVKNVLNFIEINKNTSLYDNIIVDASTITDNIIINPIINFFTKQLSQTSKPILNITNITSSNSNTTKIKDVTYIKDIKEITDIESLLLHHYTILQPLLSLLSSSSVRKKHYHIKILSTLVKYEKQEFESIKRCIFYDNYLNDYLNDRNSIIFDLFHNIKKRLFFIEKLNEISELKFNLELLQKAFHNANFILNIRSKHHYQTVLQLSENSVDSHLIFQKAQYLQNLFCCKEDNFLSGKKRKKREEHDNNNDSEEVLIFKESSCMSFFLRTEIQENIYQQQKKPFNKNAILQSQLSTIHHFQLIKTNPFC